MKHVLIISVLLTIFCINNQLHANTVEDLVYIWNAHYDDSGVRQNHPNRKNFEKYAKFVENALDRLKTEYEESGESLGLSIKYPKYDRYLHIIMGCMILVETNIKADAVGKIGEVGLIQVQGVAQAGYSKKEIKGNPELSVYLGTRWFLHCLFLSGKEIKELKDYGQALSFYACGHKCKGKLIKAAKKRLKLAYFYQGGVVKPIERIVEAVSYQLSGGENWWEQFDSKTEALKTLNHAKRSDDDELKEYLVELFNEGIIIDEDYGIMFKRVVKQLKQQLEED